ncbi:N-acetylmuramoyl-L-alanine amidase [Corynebacterium doosanense]|uniref:Peptidoglycan recognition protein family domain-containing protein n=1 Tax=Corynebacterium doosanense CAU 212 = DSM 45436 TaxID=558173 RepID=A0A097IIR0_9CORY|nr:N-acetylmuramoyl-L-alanine amidase [Corynebacterium doosanense]AIT62014.1 hypothetical protein CDOO_12655 [Corynebacterium doosanense CAU 212 = DSM 45436]
MQQRRRITSPTATGALRANPTVAVLTVAALVAATVFGGNSIYQAQSEGGDPIPVAEQSVNFGEFDNVVVEDAAIASQGGQPGPKTVKEFTSDTPFSMFALTWNSDEDFASFVRAENADGEWGPWYAAAPMGEPSADGKRGTDLIYVEPTQRIQVSVAGVDLGITDADATPADEASLENVPEEAPVAGAGINPEWGTGGPDTAATEEAAAEPQPLDETADTDTTGLAPIASNYGDIQPVAEAEAEAETEDSGPISADNIEAVLIDPSLDAGLNEGNIELAATTDGMPKVISRAGWGANQRLSNTYYNAPVKAVTIHHTAGSNNYSEAESAALVRGIQTYHGSTLGWGDVGYNAMVDKYGNIYEGRAGGLDKAVQGAHVGGFNSNTWGISVLGNYETAQPADASVRAVGQLAGWKAAVSGFNPTGTTYLASDFNYNGNKYGVGQGTNFPTINAHRDFQYNSCPGGNLYAKMSSIRSIASERYNSIKNGTPIGGNQTSTPSTPGNPATPTTTKPATTKPATTPAGNTSPLDLIRRALNGDVSAIITIVGSIAAILLGTAASNGTGNAGTARAAGDVEILDGLKISELPPIIDGLVSLTGDSEIEQKWNTINSAFGPVLGNSKGGVSTAGIGGPTPEEAANARFALFDNGIIVSDDETGTHALWGALADAWAGQGYDVGPLGMPTSDPVSTGNGGELKVDFEGGSITYDPATNKLHISTN